MFKCQMYSLREFPKHLRTGFVLPGDPYVLPQAIEYLRELWVIFYRDENHGDGLVIQPADSGEPIQDRVGYLAYNLSCGLSSPDQSPVIVKSWSGDPSSQKYREYIAKHGDDKAWFIWNKIVVIQSLNSGTVQCS